MPAKSPSKPQAPPPAALLAVYGILGSALSFLFGRSDPGDVPANLVAEICPSIIVICTFLVTYSVYDVMACGVAKQTDEILAKKYEDYPARVPEAVYLAERAQANQVEQIPCFLVSTICFSVLVNGNIGAVLAMLWAILRRLYAAKYRSSVGIPLNKKGLSAYTIPCYFIVNTMLMSSAVHALRWVVMARVAIDK